MFVCVSFSVFLSVSLSVSVCVSLFVSLYVSLLMSVCVSLSVSLSVSVSVSVSVSLSVGDGIIRTAVDLRTVTTDTIICTVSVTDGKNTVNDFVVTVKLSSEFLIVGSGVIIVIFVIVTNVCFAVTQCITLARRLIAVPAGFPSRGGDVAGYVFDRNQPSLPSPFYSVLVSVSVLMALSFVFNSINPPDNSLLFYPVPPVLCLPY